MNNGTTWSPEPGRRLINMSPGKARWLAAAGAALALASSIQGQDDTDELDSLVQEALVHSPLIQAARESLGQATAAREAHREFFDPVTTATAGRLTGSATVPLLATPAGLPFADAYGAAASVEVPVSPGLYAGIAATEQYLVDPPAGTAPGSYTLVGAQLRLPLFQDRGFNAWRQGETRLKKLETASAARLLEVRQTVRHAVEQAYVNYLAELANAATAASATERARQLLKEAEELVRLKVVPEYQLAPARLELALRLEEEGATDQAIDTARIRLIQAIGTTPSKPLAAKAETLLARISLITPERQPSHAGNFASRGAVREIDALAAATAAETRAFEDQLRSDLSLSLRGVWAAENSRPSDSSQGSVVGETPAVAAVLVWTRPWSQTGPKARLSESRAREMQIAQQALVLNLALTANLASARRVVNGTRERLSHLHTAVEQARITLEAEAERFRLGEGRSRNVLDAQNDLTKACRSRDAVAAELLKGYSDLVYATGYPEDPTLQNDPVTGGKESGGHQ